MAVEATAHSDLNNKGTEQEPLVSAIIPTYNGWRNLVEAVESVLAQDYSRIEVIVVDDGSTDETPDKMMPYADRITYIRQANAGPAAARNTGIEHARGDYIAFLDSDDLWHPEKIREQVDYFQSQPEVGIICTDAREFDETGTFSESFLAQFGEIPRTGWVFETIAATAFPLTSTVMIRKVCIDDGLRFRRELTQFQDIDFFMRLNLRYPIATIKEKLVDRRLHEGNRSKDHYKRFFNRTVAFSKILSDGTPLTAGQRRSIRRLLAFAQSKVGGCHWGRFDMKEARRWYWKALRFDAVGIDALLHVILSFLPVRFIALLRRLKRGKNAFTPTGHGSL